MQETERILREMIEEAHPSPQTVRPLVREKALDDLFGGRKDWPTPPPAQFPRIKKADRRSDFAIAALGITLGLICALFPWYIFFNQEQFGVQAIRLGGSGNGAGRGVAAQLAGMQGKPVGVDDFPVLDLDLLSTGTVQEQPEDPAKAPGVDEQPFPAPAPQFQFVHVANGRAMIEDDSGLFIVQRGSTLPDSSRVAAIEQRGNKWVIVTSKDQIIELSR